jgi:hypothetical protein
MKYVVTILLAFILANGIAGIYNLPPPVVGGSDKISCDLVRYEELRRDLQPMDTVGYVSQGEIIKPKKAGEAGRTVLELESYLRFVRVQYAIAPTLLVHSSEPTLIVGNFTNGNWSSDPNIIGQSLIHVRKDYGNGVVLFEHP